MRWSFLVRTWNREPVRTDSMLSAVSLVAITCWLGLAVASLLRDGSARKLLLYLACREGRNLIVPAAAR